MSVQHQHSIRTSFLSGGVQGACGGNLLALPCGRSSTSVGVWHLQDATAKPLELVGHRKAVTALAFSHSHAGPLLCSCADDYIIVWNIQKSQSARDAGQEPRGVIIGKLFAGVRYCVYSPDDNKIAICVEKCVYILDSRQEKTLCTLEGHISTVNCADFCPHYTSTVVTASEDRTFKIWDISNGRLVYQSTIISSAPFISLCMDPVEEQFALGTTDGQIRAYDMRDGNGFRCLWHFDVSKAISKVKQSSVQQQQKAVESSEGPVTISSKPSWQRSEAQPSGDEEETAENDAEAGCAILAMFFWYSATPKRPPTPATLPFLRKETVVSHLLAEAPSLVIGTTADIFVVNARTLEPLLHCSLQEPVPSASVFEESTKSLSIAGSILFAQYSRQVWCCVGSLFASEVHLLTISQPSAKDRASLSTQLTSSASMPDITHSATATAESSNREGTGAEETSQEITVLSNVPLVENSILKAELTLKPKSTDKEKTAAKRASWSGRYSSFSTVSNGRESRASIPGQLDKKGQIVDNQPLTFKSRVKSSGYGSVAPRTDMFKPRISSPSKSPSKPMKATASSESKMVVKEYPLKSEVPTQFHTKLDVAERPTAVNTIKFSEDGAQLACALANTSAQVFKMPLTGKGYAFTGHSGSVTCAQWSKDGKWLITSSDDRSASVWSTSLSDPVMTIKTVHNNLSADREGIIKPTKDNPAFPKEVKHGQFYYMDKFLLLSCGNSFNLYKYNLDTVKSDIKRYLSNNKYKLVQSFQLDQAQTITAFSAINTFYSYIVLTAGSNKTIEVFDMNKGQSLRVIQDAHTRPIHTIKQNEGSNFVTHPPGAYDLFVTAAASDCIRLWDLRTNRCVQRFEGHVNRIHPCGLAFSPCSRFIATGAEDRCAYIYDVRSGTYLHKLLGHTETVGDVAFHPLVPQIVTASLDGRLRLFKEK